MHDFPTNAIATGTVPDIIGWHNLNANPIAPGDIGTALKNDYRPLETSLGVSGAQLQGRFKRGGQFWSAAAWVTCWR